MILTWYRFLVFAVAILLFDWPSAQADYWYARTDGGDVRVTTFPDTDFGSLQAGQARILFEAWFSGSSHAQPAFIDSVAFNTDLILSPGQITAPQGWELTPNVTVPGKGRFSWGLHTLNPQEKDWLVGVMIDGLGEKPSASHFWLPSKTEGISPPATPATFAFHIAAIDYYQGPNMPWLRVPQGPDTAWSFLEDRPPDFPHPTPEPCTLALAGLGLAGVLAARRLTAHK
jgi:hypothetical protein